MYIFGDTLRFLSGFRPYVHSKTFFSSDAAAQQYCAALLFLTKYNVYVEVAMASFFLVCSSLFLFVLFCFVLFCFVLFHALSTSVISLNYLFFIKY